MPRCHSAQTDEAAQELCRVCEGVTRVEPDTSILGSGLDALRQELSVADILRLIERTARWVDPATFRALPVWFPEYSRGCHFYKSNWSEPLFNTKKATGQKEHKKEGNRYANEALTHALGSRKKERPDWSCCHIWGVDDPTYASTNVIVKDSRFYSCVANMVLLPSPLKAFTDVMPSVKAMLRTCAYFTYGWECDYEASESIDHAQVAASADYPCNWPSPLNEALPAGLVPINQRIKVAIARRKARIRSDLKTAGPHYPRVQVKETLDYWRVNLDS